MLEIDFYHGCGSAQMLIAIISNIIICRTVWAYARHPSIAPCPQAILSAGGIPTVVFDLILHIVVYSLQICQSSFYDCWLGSYIENMVILCVGAHTTTVGEELRFRIWSYYVQDQSKRLTPCSHARLSCITPHATLRRCGKVSSIHTYTLAHARCSFLWHIHVGL